MFFEESSLRGKAIWALSFLSFLSGLNAIIAVLIALDLGLTANFQPYLFDSFIGSVPVYVYLVGSLLGTLAFLGGTAHRVVKELSNLELLTEINQRTVNLENGQTEQGKTLETLKARVFLVDEAVNSMRKDVAKAFTKQSDDLKHVHADIVKRLDSELTATKTVIARQLSEQEAEIKEDLTTLSTTFDTKLAETRDGLTRQLADLDATMTRHEQRNKTTDKHIQAQAEEIAAIKLELARLEEAFVTPKACLTSDSKVEDVRGIGENTGKDLRQNGVSNVGELLVSDPAVVAQRTGMSEKQIEKLQGRAQLAMVPGITEKDLVLLEEVGVTNQKELAAQDPFELGRKINDIFKATVEKGKISGEKPKVEEIYSWVKFAKA
jgi:cell pole-organizing protein PopZ